MLLYDNKPQLSKSKHLNVQNVRFFYLAPFVGWVYSPTGVEMAGGLAGLGRAVVGPSPLPWGDEYVAIAFIPYLLRD